MTDEEQEVVDMQEARSIRYSDQIGLAWLSSGKWAVFTSSATGAESFRNEITIVEELDMVFLKRLGHAQLLERQQEEQEYEERRARLVGRPGEATVAPKGLEEMGL